MRTFQLVVSIFVVLASAALAAVSPERGLPWALFAAAHVALAVRLGCLCRSEQRARGLLSIALLLPFSPALHAQPALPTNLVALRGAKGAVALQWQANTETNLVGYFVHYGGATTNYTNSTWVGNVTNATVAVGSTNTLYFAVTAVNDIGLESDPSNEVATTPLRPPARPALLRTAVLRLSLLRADDPKGPWTAATNFPEMVLLADGKGGFYKTAPIEIEQGPPLSNGH